MPVDTQSRVPLSWGCPSVRVEKIHRASTAGLMILSLAAFLTVAAAALGILLSGQLPAPEKDEGTGAHIFQLSVAALLPVGLLFLGTADWTHPGRIVRGLVLPATLTIAAFVVLYYFEHSLHRV